ncbi:MAG: APC family permease, partial [Bryobacteraceae bacterium]
MPEPGADAAPAQPAALHRTLGLRDVSLLGIACIVGTRWLSTAAHTGPGSVTLFLLAGLFFVVPMAASIGVLAARRPHAGGQYVWAREDFGEWHGFLAFWLYWVGIASWFPNAAMAYMSIGAYAIDPKLVEHRTLIVGASVVAIWIGMGANIAGVRIGRWIQNFGGFATWIIVGILLTVATIVYMKRGSATVLDIAPPLGWATVNFWSQIAFALSGLELLGMMGGEIKDPEKTIPRAGWIAGMVSVFFYSSASLALIVLLKPADISIVYGIMQGARIVQETLGASWIPYAFAGLSMITAIGQFGGLGSGTARLSYAAAQDGLLPPIFARIHPRWRTPHISMFALAGTGTALLLIMQLGDTMRAAYQELVSMMVLGSFVPYLYIFASAWKAGKRLAPLSGLAVTSVALIFCAVPTEDITNVWLFEGKIIGGSAILVGLGRWIF